MKRNSRLSLALHTLSHMAGDPNRLRTSADIAAHADTNAVVVRRVLGQLRKAGLLTSEKGHAGGWRLAHPPEDITFADVYLALGDKLVSGNTSDPAPVECTVETRLQSRVSQILDDVEASLVERLKETSITDLHPASCGYCDD